MFCKFQKSNKTNIIIFVLVSTETDIKISKTSKAGEEIKVK